MGAYSFEEIRDHIGHDLECVRYGQNDKCVNVSIECITCGEVLIDLHPNEYLAKEKDNDLTCPECKNDSSDAEYEILREDDKTVFHCIECGYKALFDEAFPLEDYRNSP